MNGAIVTGATMGDRVVSVVAAAATATASKMSSTIVQTPANGEMWLSGAWTSHGEGAVTTIQARTMTSRDNRIWATIEMISP